MGIQDFNIDHSVQDAVGAARDKTLTTFSNITGSVDSSMGHQYAGGSFVGVSAQGCVELKDAIEKYINTIQGIINGFNENADISRAFAGFPRVAAEDFIKAIKQVLTSYVSSLRMIKSEADEVLRNYQENAQNISNVISTDADTLRSAANDINLDI